MNILLLAVALAVCHISYVLAYPAESKVLETLEQLTGKEGARAKEGFEYLRKFGYLNRRPQAMTWADYEESMMRMQKMMGVPQTAMVDDATYEAMQKPRCGNTEGHVYSLDDERDWEEEREWEEGAESDFKLDGKWSKRDLSFRVLNYKTGMNTAEFDRAVFNAFKLWTDVTSLTITPSKCSTVDVSIRFGSEFLDATTVVARGYFPPYGIVVFNQLTTWAWRPATRAQGYNMEIVAAHEFGHMLGLHHSEVVDSIMNPTYPMNQQINAAAQLKADDIKGIRAQYGDENTPYGTPSPIDPTCVDKTKQF